MLLTQVNPQDGLHFKKPVNLNARVSIIIGKNGAGKSRLLRAVATGNITVTDDSSIIPVSRIRLDSRLDARFGSEHIMGLGHGQDFRSQLHELYLNNRGKFNKDPFKSIQALGQTLGSINHSGMGSPNLHSMVAHVASIASEKTGIDINSLNIKDIDDYYSPEAGGTLGQLNIAAVVRLYISRIRENRQAKFDNNEFGETNVVYSEEEFEKKFGPPPWDVINTLLKDGLGHEYRISIPELRDRKPYELKLFRFDGKEIASGALSNGEGSLLWLVFTMYSANLGLNDRLPKLLLLDEPDSFLHPAMMEKFYNALNVIVEKFDCKIIMTTHSPTTVALSGDYDIYEVDENMLVQIEKDAAISNLLRGVNQVSILYTHRRQVYVESNGDDSIYTEIFRLVRSWNYLKNSFISLAFIPAAPKLPDASVASIVRASFGGVSDEKMEEFLAKINGEGNSASIKATVKSLSSRGNQTVHGIIDWDLNNKAAHHIHVHAENIFYSMENAVLNPLTLGVYLLTQHQKKINVSDFGLPPAFDSLSLYAGSFDFQIIVNKICEKVLGVGDDMNTVRCEFLGGQVVNIPTRYAHHHGHKLQDRIFEKFEFLKEVAKKRPLMEDVIGKTIGPFNGRMLPRSFLDLFTAIQLNEISV
jgi:ABC-type multidrug transport system ATPase subunit